jgi:hypothetical protein
MLFQVEPCLNFEFHGQEHCVCSYVVCSLYLRFTVLRMAQFPCSSHRRCSIHGLVMFIQSTKSNPCTVLSDIESPYHCILAVL